MVKGVMLEPALLCQPPMTSLRRGLAHQMVPPPLVENTPLHAPKSMTMSLEELYQVQQGQSDKSEDKAEGGTSVESSIPYSHGGRALVIKGAKEVENAKAEVKELHKTSVDGLLIKIAESKGLWVDAGVLDQGTK
ncbi:hypothetical protein BHM03_00058440 [Ensete ventricosum]|nr:hypothetical protein BHM03_00058440 [Ensete ventricosum]